TCLGTLSITNGGCNYLHYFMKNEAAGGGEYDNLIYITKHLKIMFRSLANVCITVETCLVCTYRGGIFTLQNYIEADDTFCSMHTTIPLTNKAQCGHISMFSNVPILAVAHIRRPHKDGFA
ncbi:hypothetical protein ACJX0J_025471, partial [Zea mays]